MGRDLSTRTDPTLEVAFAGSMRSSAPMRIRLFAYGTLQVGHEAAHRLDIVAAEPGTITGFRLYDTGLGWPMAAVGTAHDRVHGQLLTLAGDDSSGPDVAAAFARADEWEGYDPDDPDGSPYLRVEVEAVTAAGDTVATHVYVSSEERLRRHYEGVALAHLEQGVWAPD